MRSFRVLAGVSTRALDSGGEGILECTPTEAGEFAYCCTVDGHTDAGMTGTLVVS